MRVRKGYTEYWIGKPTALARGLRADLGDSRVTYRLLNRIISSDALLGILRRLVEACARAHSPTIRRSDVLTQAANLVERGRLEVRTIDRTPQSRVTWSPQPEKSSNNPSRPLIKPQTAESPASPALPRQRPPTREKAKETGNGDLPQCDVQTLVLADSRSKSTLSCNRPKRGAPLLADVPSRLKPLLQRYDLVLEVISLDNPAPKNEKGVKERQENPRKTKVKIDRTHLGGCGKHPLVTLSRSGEVLNSWKEAPGEHELALRHLGNELFGDGKVGSIFSAIVPLNSSVLGPTDEFEVTAHSCGVRAGGSPFHNHQALIRVYDGSKWAVSLSAQKARSITYDQGKHNDKEKKGRQTTKIETSEWGKTEDDKDAWPVKFSITRDELELDCTKPIKLLIDKFILLKKKSKGFIDLLKGTPKVGFYGSLDFSFLEGSCEASCEKSIRMGNSGRHTEFVATYALAAKIRLVEFKVSGAYGVEVTSKLYAAILKLELTVGAFADIDYSHSTTFEAETAKAPKWHIPVASDVTANFALKAEVSVMGRGIKGEGGVRGGLAIKADAEIRFGGSSGLHASFSIRREKTNIHGYYIVDAVIWHTEKCYEKEVWGDGDLVDASFGGGT